jgi:hypothetical protein
MTPPIQFPVCVRLKDCHDVVSFHSAVAMVHEFEKIDVENGEYEAWESQAEPIKMFIEPRSHWLRLEPVDWPEPEKLRNAIKEFARTASTAWRFS